MRQLGREPDEGIWEVRGGRQHFVYSRLMCWVALDRGLRLADKRSFPADRQRWLEDRDEIYEEIMSRGWSRDATGLRPGLRQRRAWTRRNLIMPLVVLRLPARPALPRHPGRRSSATWRSGSLVYRYDLGGLARTGCEGEEGTFSMCSFWLRRGADPGGTLEEARLVFEKMLAYANHLGLYAEQIGPTGEAARATSPRPSPTWR